MNQSRARPKRSAAKAGEPAGGGGGRSGGRSGGGGGRRGRRPEPLPDPLLTALEEALRLEMPADAVLRRFFRANAQLGRRDRAMIAETVFDVLRHRRSYAQFAQAGTGPMPLRLAWLSLTRRGLLEERGALRIPLPTPEDRTWLARVQATDESALPPAVALSLPDWLYERLCGRFGVEEAQALARSLLAPASLQLRTNTLKTRPDALLARLGAEGIEARPVAMVPGALEVRGHPALEKQDAGSQLLALLVGARRGQTVIDLCAGAGGKTLALAATMNSQGQVFACDVSVARLQRLRPRLVRSGASNVQPFAIDSLADPKLERLAGRADAVLIDAPCTGTGTLRRNPDLKWRMDERDLERLVAEQRSILDAAVRLLKPGGVLVYATCSLLAEENEAQAAWFEARFPRFVREDVREVLRVAGAELPEDAIRDGALICRPNRHETDAFYGIRWRLAGDSGKKAADRGG